MTEPSSQSSHQARPDTGIFVGRQREMAEFRAALHDALSGHGRLVMLVGEPGIGKTCTAQELAVLAEQRGAQLIWGWCYEQQGAPPFWPWVQSIRSYVQSIDSKALASAVTCYAPVERIESYGEQGKYNLVFSEKAKPIGPIPLGIAVPLQGPRYTTVASFRTAKALSDLRA